MCFVEVIMYAVCYVAPAMTNAIFHITMEVQHSFNVLSVVLVGTDNTIDKIP